MTKTMIFIFIFIVFNSNQFSFVHNHAHSNEPLLLLVSFDGFRWDYLNHHDLPNFNSLKQNGTYTDFIYNSFATVIFPNQLQYLYYHFLLFRLPFQIIGL